MSDRLRPYERWFADFTDSHVPDDPDAAYLLDRKRLHVHRVRELAREIAAQSDPDPDRLFLVELAALLHDVGRFPLMAQEGAGSKTDHGRLGARIVHAQGLLEGLPLAWRKAVLSTINYHNRTAMPGNLPCLSGFVLAVVRDADKLDVLGRMVGRLKPGNRWYGLMSRKLVVHETRYTPAVLEQLRDTGLVDLGCVVFLNDYKLFLCGWINDLNFPASLGLLRASGDYRKLLDLLPQDEPVRATARELARRLEIGRSR